MNFRTYRISAFNKDLLAAIGIFTSIVVLLGIFFTNWGFLHDDFGVIWHTRTSLDNLLKLFTEPGMTSVYQPSNFHMPEQSFFAVLYRPFSCIFYGLQYNFFGFSAYGYFLTTIILHALNTVLLFFLLRHFLPLVPACLATLFFGFHISFWDWIGWISGQEHVINFTIILGIIHLLKYHLDTKKLIPLFVALLLFLISLFTRETAIFFPLWLPVAVYMYRTYAPQESTIFFDALKIAGSFLFVSVFYLGIRLFFYPIKAHGQGIKIILNPIDFLYNLKNRFFDAVTFLADVANLSWLSGGNRMLKGSLILFFITLVIILFINNKNKKLFLFFVASGFLFMWPALLRYYSSRYLYKTLPFFIAAGICLITQFKSAHANYSTYLVRVAGYVMVFIITLNATLLTYHMKQREIVLHETETAFKELVARQQSSTQPICFIALPNDPFITGAAQALWMFGYNQRKPIYYDQSTFVGYNTPPDKNLISITHHKNQLHIFSLDPNNVWFCDKNIFTPMGTIIINKRNDVGHAVDMTYTLDQKYVHQKMSFITWDYCTHRFATLDI